MTLPKYEFFSDFLLVALTSSGRFFLRLLLPAFESLLDLNIFTREWWSLLGSEEGRSISSISPDLVAVCVWPDSVLLLHWTALLSLASLEPPSSEALWCVLGLQLVSFLGRDAYLIYFTIRIGSWDSETHGFSASLFSTCLGNFIFCNQITRCWIGD